MAILKCTFKTHDDLNVLSMDPVLYNRSYNIIRFNENLLDLEN